jgi:23S rRNA pseudouridine1911/1915/1917 synthase
VSRDFQYVVPANNRGERLDRFLADVADDLSRARIQKLINEGLVLLDKNPAKPGSRLKEGQEVSLKIPDPVHTKLLPDPDVQFEVLHQDSEIIVVNKPPGLVVHPAAGHRTGTLVHGILAICTDLAGIGGELRPGIVHRLDKDTSGVMIVAKTDIAHQALADQFKGGVIEKYYLAICRGWPRSDQGMIDSPIGRHPVRRKEMSTRARSSRPAITKWEMRKRFGLGVSLLNLNILTGRTHQIRVHLASIGCPILGDRVYGVGLGWLKKEKTSLKGLVNRQMLHAASISFQHPATGQRETFSAPVPEDMAQVLKALEDWELNVKTDS